MNSRKSGVLTIEAALTLPLVMIALVSVLFFAKVFYIQDQIHSAMTKVAHEMSVDAYVVDKLGFVDMQQEVYIVGATDIGNINDAAVDVANQKEVMLTEVHRVTDYGYELKDWWGEAGSISPNQTFIDTCKDAVALVNKAPELVESVSGNMTGMMDAIEYLINESVNSFKNVAAMEVVDFSNGVVAGQMSKAMFRHYIEDEQLVAWGITEGVDFSLSTYMMPDDTVELVGAYLIDLPFGHEWFGEGIPVFQKVKARAWTGSYDSGEEKHRQEPEEDETKEEIFYIATASEANHSYHYYQCLVKPLKTSTYHEAVSIEKRKICLYCKDHCEVGSEEMTVYFTGERSKVHLSEDCPRIKSVAIEAVTEAEAISRGYDMCDRYGCVAKTREKMDE